VTEDDRPPSALIVTNLSKTFPGTKALREVDFEVRAGEIHALVGQNGSGKSTLIKILAGFHQPDSGAAGCVNGADFTLGDAAEAHRAGLRFVHQDLGLVESLDCVDNLALGFGYATSAGRIKWRAQRAKARLALGSLGDNVDIRKPVARLTPFEKTALAIVRAVQNEGVISLLVLDEPTATMPKPQVERLFGLIRRVASQGTAVLLVSHHLEEVFTVADRVTVLRDGRNTGTREVAGLTSSELVQLMTGGVIEEIDHTAEVHPGEVVITAQGLCGRALAGFDLELHRGEVLGIAGLEGSGREEICEMVFGSRPRTGTVAMQGKLLPPERPDLSIGRGLAMVPANRHVDGLIMTQSVRENLTLVDVSPFWRRGRLSRRTERRTVKDWISKLSIRTNSMETVVEALSGGNQQKVVMGKWLRLSPTVLLLDEPTQGVDVGAQVELHRLIRSAAEGGSAVLVCSSDENELARVCDRVQVLCDGVVETELRGGQITAARIAQHSLRVVEGSEPVGLVFSAPLASD
jgi:ribose transport system ATP-binding protein